MTPTAAPLLAPRLGRCEFRKLAPEPDAAADFGGVEFLGEAAAGADRHP